MGVSKNNGIPKSWILIRFSIINHPFWGTIIFGNTHIVFHIPFMFPSLQGGYIHPWAKGRGTWHQWHQLCQNDTIKIQPQTWFVETLRHIFSDISAKKWHNKDKVLPQTDQSFNDPKKSFLGGGETFLVKKAGSFSKWWIFSSQGWTEIPQCRCGLDAHQSTMTSKEGGQEGLGDLKWWKWWKAGSKSREVKSEVRMRFYELLWDLFLWNW